MVDISFSKQKYLHVHVGFGFNYVGGRTRGGSDNPSVDHSSGLGPI